MFRQPFLLARNLVRPTTVHPSAQRISLRNLRSISSTTRREAYIRFSTPGGPPTKPQNNLHGKWDPRMKGAVVILGLGGLYYVSHLEQVPETGRWRFMNTSPSFEAQFAEMTRKQMRASFGSNTLPPNHPVSRHVRRVVSRILHASNLGVLHGESPLISSPFGLGHDSEGHAWNPDAGFGAAADPGDAYGPSKEWDVIVVNDVKTMNAMALPGIIVVFTGILPVCQDEEGLAAVLAHVARHSAERLSAQTIAWTFLLGLAVLGIDMGITDFVQKLFVDLPNSRTQEHEG
ncbi:Mitochondrial metalloendopeptidase OMA1 [Psilocybe cubensis]|uniref:Mitochondrial metalloendopeptidase OMA1 n=1 Tax=Psilocybe cubensis TaxID=181762 RepID=A0ACB8GJ50_PSICU|nr:Mitochondrial metalloendopeptidase OMA1 [Psilocybe cubensis]KAH9475558.1 Mitochondrial metalloendopeptidase OMA1 [Psilocybe cubensis]